MASQRTYRYLSTSDARPAQKGQLALLEAFRVIRHSVPSYLVMLGRQGDMSEVLRQQIDEMGLSESVSIVGYTPDVAHYLEHASVFVFPSFMEGLGTSVIEAMSFDIQVVAFDIPPVREITDDGRLARLVPVGRFSCVRSTGDRCSTP